MISIRDIRDRVFDQKNIDAARFALQSAIAASAAFAAVHWTGLGEEFLTVISAVFVVQPSVGGTASTGWNRIFATILGTIVGFALLYLLPTAWGTMIAIGVSMLVVNLIAAFNIDWRYGVIAAAAMALGAESQTFDIALDRGIAIALGAGVGLAVSLIVWPDTALSRTRRHIHSAIQSAARRLEDIVNKAAADDAEPDETPRYAFHRNLDSARETAERLSDRNARPVKAVINAVETLYNSVLVINRSVTSEDDAPLSGSPLADEIARVRDIGTRAICALIDASCDADKAITDYKDCIDEVHRNLQRHDPVDDERVRRAALIFGLYEVYRSLLILKESLGEAGEIDHGIIASARRIAAEARPPHF